MKKKLLIVAVVALVIIVAAIALLMGNINTLAQRGIEKSLTYILQVDVSLDSVNVVLTEGSVELKGLTIGNPEGFKTEKAFSAGSIAVKADIASFRTDEPVIENISIDGMQVTLEQGLGSSNLSKLIASASRFDSGGGEAKESTKSSEESQAAQKQIVIDKVTIQNTKVGLSATMLGGKQVDFTIPRIEMKDIGRGGEKVNAAKAMAMLLQEVLKQALSAGGNLIPKDLSGVLGGVGETGEALSNQLQDSGKAVGDSLKGAAEGLTGMFKKKEE